MVVNYLAITDIPSRYANALQIIQMSNAFVKNGHKVNLIIPNFKSLNQSIKSYYDVTSKINLIRLGKKKDKITKIDNILLPLKLVFKNLFIKKDLIITRNLVISLILIIFRIEHILELHDDLKISGNILSKIFKILRLLNSKSILRLVFITNNLKKFVSKNYNYNRKNFKILPDATSIITKKLPEKSNKSKFKIGYFGSIYKSRGIELIFKLAKLDKKNQYYIYGGTKFDKKKLQKFKLKNLRINSQIPYKKVKKKISQMDVLLMPYTEKVTTAGDVSNIINFMSPMKMFDYLGSGKILITSNIKVLKEILKNNYNCIIIKNYKSVNSWKKQIDQINLNKYKYLNIRLNALQTAKKYTWENRADQMLKNIQ